MRNFYTSRVNDRVVYNCDDPDKQVILEEDYSENRSVLWGLIHTKYEKTIRQSFEDKKAKGLGFK